MKVIKVRRPCSEKDRNDFITGGEIGGILLAAIRMCVIQVVKLTVGLSESIQGVAV